MVSTGRAVPSLNWVARCSLRLCWEQRGPLAKGQSLVCQHDCERNPSSAASCLPHRTNGSCILHSTVSRSDRDAPRGASKQVTNDEVFESRDLNLLNN